MDVTSYFDERENRFSQMDNETGSNASGESAARPVVYSTFRNRRVSNSGQDRNSKTVTKNLVGRFSCRFGFRSIRRRTKQDYCEYITRPILMYIGLLHVVF